MVADEILVKYYIKLKGEDKFKVLTEDFGSEEYGVGIRKGDAETVEAINNAFEEIKEVANYITDTNENDGVAKAIEHLVLNS